MFLLIAAQLAASSAEMPSDKMLARAPVLTLESAQTADQLQQCIGLALAGIGRPMATRVPGRRYLTFSSVAKSPVLITISEETPRHIEARTSFLLNHKWRNRIRFCAS